MITVFLEGMKKQKITGKLIDIATKIADALDYTGVLAVEMFLVSDGNTETSIVNEIAEGKPSPDIKLGLVGYRDKGDAYVTTKHQAEARVFDVALQGKPVLQNLDVFAEAQGRMKCLVKEITYVQLDGDVERRGRMLVFKVDLDSLRVL